MLAISLLLASVLAQNVGSVPQPSIGSNPPTASQVFIDPTVIDTTPDTVQPPTASVSAGVSTSTIISPILVANGPPINGTVDVASTTSAVVA
jgi:hypothetical protein